MSLGVYVIYVLPFLLIALSFGAAGASILSRRARAARRRHSTQVVLDNSSLLPRRHV